MESLPYKISSLVYLRDRDGKLLLMKRRKAPNKGLWSPIGGKLEMGTGESPHQAAAREIKEEVDLEVSTSDLHLFAMIAEKNYEDRCHWLMFLFDCRKALESLPPPIDEGDFAFFEESEIDKLDVPATDRSQLWRFYFESRNDFVALSADCHSDKELSVNVDEFMPLRHGGEK
ncbi:MAG: NUDIX domain-containing protein [Puniceicoccaceae bacterium]